ncbi:MAG TPA: NTP transferase domain-containing protein [Bacteroidales bacterium]|nr:NTP transferase domain-containing protein [Bacteroidales bacterium]
MNRSANDIKIPWAVVVLSAGNSTRMKQHKALLKFDKHRTFIKKIADEYEHAGCSKIIIVVNEQNMVQISHQFDHCKGISPSFVLNKNPEYERFYSIKLGLEACRNFDRCFIQHCDNPFITAGLIEKMIQLSMDESYISPAYKGKKGHPVLLGSNVIQDICATNKNNSNFKLFLRNYKCIEFNAGDKNILNNINDLNDYMQFFQKIDNPKT